jgi:predicted CXXCH cytochrome family protein
MIKENVSAQLSKMVLIISVFALMVTTLPDHLAWGMQSVSRPGSDETCLFTLQLKEDPAIKRRYVSMVISATQRNSPNFQSVEEMYADVSKASVEEYDGDYLPSLPKNNPREIGVAQDIDSLSALCLGCHDGLAAHVVTVDVRNNPFKGSNTVSSINMDHPIGMDYNRYVISGKGYKPIYNNSKMIFANGKVGCLTCHDPFNPEKSHLVMSDQRSALCLTCHKK